MSFPLNFLIQVGYAWLQKDPIPSCPWSLVPHEQYQVSLCFSTLATVWYPPHQISVTSVRLTPLNVKLFSTLCLLLILRPMVDASGSPLQKTLLLIRTHEWLAPHESFCIFLFLLLGLISMAQMRVGSKIEFVIFYPLLQLQLPVKYIAPFTLLAKREWLSPAAIRSIGSSIFTWIGIFSMPLRPSAPSSLHPKVKTRPSVVSTTEWILPQAILQMVWLYKGLGIGSLDLPFYYQSSSSRLLKVNFSTSVRQYGFLEWDSVLGIQN